MSKEYAIYNWLTGSVFPAGDTLSGAERVWVHRLEVDRNAGLNGNNLEVVTIEEARRLRRAHIIGYGEGRRLPEGMHPEWD